MGWVFGALCLVGAGFLFGRRWRHHHRHHHAHHRRGGCGRHRRWEREDDLDPGEHRDRFVRMARKGLSLREEQIPFVEGALGDAKKAIDRFTADLRETRGDLAEALSGDQVDDARLSAAFESHDDAIRQVRKDVVEVAKRLHSALDPEQRRKLAQLFEADRGRWI